MQKLAFFKGLVIGLSLSSCLWMGIFISVKNTVKKISLRKSKVLGAHVPVQNLYVAVWPER
jgi:hypothetical protein